MAKEAHHARMIRARRWRPMQAGCGLEALGFMWLRKAPMDFGFTGVVRFELRRNAMPPFGGGGWTSAGYVGVAIPEHGSSWAWTSGANGSTVAGVRPDVWVVRGSQ